MPNWPGAPTVFGKRESRNFNAAYDRYGLKQRCWAHLLRETYELKAQHPSDVKLRRWRGQGQRRLCESKRGHHRGSRKRLRPNGGWQERLLGQCQPYADGPSAVQGKL